MAQPPKNYNGYIYLFNIQRFFVLKLKRQALVDFLGGFDTLHRIHSLQRNELVKKYCAVATFSHRLNAIIVVIIFYTNEAMIPSCVGVCTCV